MPESSYGVCGTWPSIRLKPLQAALTLTNHPSTTTALIKRKVAYRVGFITRIVFVMTEQVSCEGLSLMAFSELPVVQGIEGLGGKMTLGSKIALLDGEKQT